MPGVSFLFSCIFLFALHGCVGPGERVPSNLSNDTASIVASVSVVEKTSFETVDGWKVSGDYYGGSGAVAVIMLHQLGKDRSSYDEFARAVRAQGFRVLTIDSRGHGESVNKGTWNSFGDAEFNAMADDVRAAKDFLWGKGARKFVVVGASIGANTAINYGCVDRDAIAIVALSPGLDYRGIQPLQAVKSCGKPIFFVAGSGDAYSADSVEELFEACPSKFKEKKVYPSSAHGTDLFAQTSLRQDLVSWIERTEKQSLT